jgi:outer membrane receptor protein involved in Fe transport
MRKKTKLTLLGASMLLGLGALPAFAQPQPPAEESAAEDEVVVTGSRLRRDPANAPAPLIQLTQEDLLQSGEPNLVDYLADVPALSGSTVPEDTTGANLNDGGLSLLNLRDLGAVRTLVLVDGRRHVGAPAGGLQVDVDSIPTLLVDNVEIVTGGQAAVYGADAVSGVVNFIMRRDYEGLDIDAALSQINQDGQESRRISAIIGHNFMNDRLNLYGFAEHQEFDEVRDSQIDWKTEAWVLLNNDSDPNNATPDNQLDNILIRGARDAFFQRGGLFLLANQVLNSPAADPDLVAGNCGNSVAPQPLAQYNAATANIAVNANCFNVAPENFSTYVFSPAGVARPFNFGTFQDQNGASRRINIGGDGLNTGTEFGQGSRIPESTADRYQVGLNFDVTDNVQAFAEAKFVREETFDEGQPTFFQGGIGQSQPGLQNRFISLTNFNIGDDNAFMDPAFRALMLANDRNLNNASTTQVLDRRATFNLFGPVRTQFNTREVTRYVGGLRGDLEQVGFVNNVDWEIGYTYGKTENENDERGVDVIRFHYSVDAVRDTAGLLGTPNAIVCRNRLLLAQGFTVNDPLTGAPSAANNAIINACVPQSIFGVDLRADGYNPAAESYYNATITVSHVNHQQDLLAFAAGELWDFWGAGPIGLSVGYEWRREKTAGVGRDADTAGRLLFLNTGPDFAGASYNATEYFGEISVPLFRNHPVLGESAEFSGAYRYSDYSTVGGQEARSAQLQWRPIGDLLLRGTYGESIRVPNLAENFAPPAQTFANGLNDPCDRNSINTLSNLTTQANRNANCLLLGIPATYTVVGSVNGTYPSGRSGVNSGNPFLEPEKGRSFTWSIAYQPSWFENFSVVFDFYDIRITDAIAAVTAQQAINQCVSDAVLNVGACSTIFRNSAAHPTNPYELPSSGVGFIQGSLNYAKTMARGIDFAASYNTELPWVLGEAEFRLRGNYLIRQEDFFNIASPGTEQTFDGTIGLPRVRFLLTTAWSPIEDLRLIWDWDWQESQEIIAEEVLINDTDNRDPRFRTTEPFSQHDFSLAYDFGDNVTLRAGVVNAFDNEPDVWLGSATTSDNFDMFGRRYFVGIRYRN